MAEDLAASRARAEALRARVNSVLERKADDATLLAAGHSWDAPGQRCRKCRAQHPCPRVSEAQRAIRLREAIQYVTDGQLLALATAQGVREA